MSEYSENLGRSAYDAIDLKRQIFHKESHLSVFPAHISIKPYLLCMVINELLTKTKNLQPTMYMKNSTFLHATYQTQTVVVI